MNDFDYKTLYNDIEPSPWAVGKLRSRIEAMQADPFEDIWRVFRQRIAVGLAITMVFVAVLHLQNRESDASFASEWNEYIGTSSADQLASSLPDYTLDVE
jgi:hypothetical protein